MYPPLWGKYYWNVLHLIAYTYDPNEKDKILVLIGNLISTLPCRYCSYHAIIYVYQNPIDLSSRETLMAWMNNFHNEVNRRTNKPVFTYEENVAATESLLNIKLTTPAITPSRNSKKNSKSLYVAIPIVILALVALSLLSRKNANLHENERDDPLCS